jgi:group I intron endonuclease
VVIKIKKREDNLYNRIGVYAVVNKVNGFTYVGQTAMNFGDRRDSHFSLLRNGKHPCKEMQIDFNKYGEKNFEFVVLCDSNSREEIDRFEIYKNNRVGTIQIKTPMELVGYEDYEVGK